jgi:hypothetical protein
MLCYPREQMKRIFGALFLLISDVSPQTNGATDWTISLHRAGPIKIGMSLGEVRRSLSDPRARLVDGPDPAEPLSECAYLESAAVPEGIAFMFAKGRVVRIDVFKTGFLTASGAGVGDSEEKIKRLYPGRITVEPHPYSSETGHYLNYLPAQDFDRGYGMVFETEANKVRSFRTGTLTAVALIEGCS